MVESRLQAQPVGPVTAGSMGSIELLGRAIHRVRNLLMSVRGYAELISMAESADPDHRRWATRIVEQVDRLEALQARVDGAMREEPQSGVHSMAMIARSAVQRSEQRLKDQASEVEVIVEVVEDLIVEADGEDLAEAIAALLDNAREAAVENGSAPVELSLRSEADGGWVLQVTDSGPGLQASDRTRLGEAFFTRKAGHLGLGLFLSQTLLERHGMQLELDRSNNDRTVASIRERRMPAGGIR
ncbi:hypothetical protein DRQ53_02225 [bacterium]|nr:MAG: hypothetical protein DRQ32_08425 [bacterium]RKZ17896.1 MAG: hypothetical protein DRQ53_02225 [bacterium]